LSAIKVLLSDIVRKPRDASSTSGTDGVIRIEYAITNDLPDGQPTVPTFADDESLWARAAHFPTAARCGDASTFSQTRLFRSASRTKP
jgi:hypothetical protein